MRLPPPPASQGSLFSLSPCPEPLGSGAGLSYSCIPHQGEAWSRALLWALWPACRSPRPVPPAGRELALRHAHLAPQALTPHPEQPPGVSVHQQEGGWTTALTHTKQPDEHHRQCGVQAARLPRTGHTQVHLHGASLRTCKKGRGVRTRAHPCARHCSPQPKRGCNSRVSES